MAAQQAATLGGVADPRLNQEVDAFGSYPNRVLQTLHDPNVTFEEYLYYAKISRADEDRLYGPDSEFTHTHIGAVEKYIPFRKREAKKHAHEHEVVAETSSPPGDGKGVVEEKADPAAVPVGHAVTDEEWLQASRAARTATWAAVFYLITTDILGPYSVAWAFSQMGWGPGLTLYTIFGALAGYSGYQLWKLFLGLDSDRYPLKNYGDIAYRVYGQWARYIVNILQSLQFFLNVGLIIISSGQSISQLSKGQFCFVGCLLVCTVAGLLVGQIRTLAKFGYIANLAVWMNIFVMIFTMGIVAHSHPNYTAVAATSPALIPNINDPPAIYTTGGSPPGLTFRDNVNGLMQAVFSYGGATLFCELMAEMRRPWDFWKGLICADLLIFCCYIFFGAFVYGYQGQYAYNPAYQGINPYNWVTVANVFALITGLIAACLYGNIGIKVIYANIFREFFHAPPLESKRGKIYFAIMVPTYWFSAYVIASVVPQFSNFSALVGALCILQFTYTFPPFLLVGFKAQRDAIVPDQEIFDPSTGRVSQHIDSGMKRWIRGLRKELLWNTWDIVYTLGALVTAILGCYSAIYSMAVNYANNPNVTSFSCKSPTG